MLDAPCWATKLAEVTADSTPATLSVISRTNPRCFSHRLPPDRPHTVSTARRASSVTRRDSQGPDRLAKGLLRSDSDTSDCESRPPADSCAWHSRIDLLLSTPLTESQMVAKTKKQGPDLHRTDEDGRKGSAVYTPLALALYDLVVLGFSNSFVWHCSSRVILDFYNEHISDRHLDIGVGTGYFLDRCRFPSAVPKIALFDLNPNSLAKTAERLRRYNPSCHMGNVLQSIDIGFSGFDSIALNYLLHCLPGNLNSKSIVFEHVKPLLNNGGVVFGSTILGKDVRRSFLAEKLMKTYNAKGVFSNLSDRQQDLEAGLKAHFDEYTIRIEGCVVLFSARKQ